MTVDIAMLRAVVTADTAQAEASLGGLAAKMGPGGPLLLGFAVAGVAIAAIGAASIKMAGDFQAGMTSLVTGAGESAKDLDKVSKGILQLAVDTGTSTKQLTDGMYMIDSAGYTVAKGGLNVLKIAAQGAKVGNADLGVVAQALTTILTDYHLKGTDAASAMNGLITTVANGKMHMQDLASSMGAVLPIASSLHIGFPQVAGAIAIMTNAGMDAQQAAQNLAHVMVAATAPNAMMIKSLKDVGLSANDLHDTLKNKGLMQTLELVFQAIGKKYPIGSTAYDEATKKILGGIVGVKVAAQLAGDNLTAYQSNIDKITASMKKGGTSVDGWNAVQGDFNFKMQKLREIFETLMITIGQHLLPAATALAVWFADRLAPAAMTASKVFDWMGQNATLVKTLLIGFAIGVAVVLVPAFIAWAAGAAAAAVATIAATWPILAIIAGIMLLVLAIQYAYTHWGWFKTAVDAVGAALQWLWKYGIMGIQIGFQALLPYLKAVGDFISGAFRTTIKAFTTDWQILVGFIDSVYKKFQGLFNILINVKNALGGALSNIGGALHNAHIPGFASGTDSAPGGLALVGEGQYPELVVGPHLMLLAKGTGVYPVTGAAGGGSPNLGGSTNYTYNVMTNDGMTIARDIERERAWQAMLHGGN